MILNDDIVMPWMTELLGSEWQSLGFRYHKSQTPLRIECEGFNDVLNALLLILMFFLCDGHDFLNLNCGTEKPQLQELLFLLM